MIEKNIIEVAPFYFLLLVAYSLLSLRTKDRSNVLQYPLTKIIGSYYHVLLVIIIVMLLQQYYLEFLL